MELSGRRVVGIDREKDSPSDDADDENAGGGQSSSLVLVGECSHQQHEYEGDGVWRDSEQLGLEESVLILSSWFLVSPEHSCNQDP